MRLFRLIICNFLVWGSLVAAADPDPNVLPICAANCINSATSDQTACASADISCLCADVNFNSQATQCISKTCTVKELLIATKLNARQCGRLVKSRDYSIVPLRTTLITIATILFSLRILNKLLGWGMKWWWDDFTIIPAYFMSVAFFSASVIMYNYGLGIDIWDLPFYDITSFLHAFYYSALVYKIEMALAKISVCLFFLRIFPSRNFRMYAYTVITLNGIVGVLFLFLDGFQCTPVNAAWKGWAKEESANCIDFPAAVYANGFANIALDVIMISLPIFEVWKLKLMFRKKLTAAIMFAMGFILTVIGILRNVNYSQHMRTTNPTSELSVLHRWALCEVMISVICACLPDLRIFILRIHALHSGREGTVATQDRSTKASHITVTSTFKTDFEVGSKAYDTESQVELVDVLSASRPTKTTLRGVD